MADCEVQSSEIDGINDEDTNTEIQVQIDGHDSGALQLVETDEAQSSAQISSAPLAMNCDKELSKEVSSQSSPPVRVPITETTDMVLTPTRTSSAPLVMECGDKVFSKVDGQTSAPVTKLQGAWAKPLFINEDTNFVSPFENNMDNSQWPALSTKCVVQREDQVISSRAKKDANRNDASQTHQIRIPTDKARFPWAARMNPQIRNLHRVTVPEYMEDGTPKVTIPDHVLLHGLQNHKEYVIGQFHRCLVPSGGLVYAVLNRLWGRKCEISVKKLGEFSYIFRIPDEATRKWILQRSLWHVDDCIMFVAPWTAKESLTLPEITSIPLWVKLKNIPTTLYSIPAIEWIASGLGEPMLSHKPWLDPTMLGEAKVMVEVELNKPFPQKVAAWDKQGNFSLVDVEYSWLPTTCEKCGQLGHKQKRCLSMSSQKPATLAIGSKIASVAHVFESSSDAATHDKETQLVPSNVPSLLQGHVRVPLQETIATSSHYGKQSNGSHMTLPKPASNKNDSSQASDQVINPSLDVINEQSKVDVTFTGTDDVASLVAVSVLENMYVPPIMVYVNETIDSLPMENAPSSTNQISTEVLKESSRIHELGLGSNKFASLVSSDGEDEDQLDLCNDSNDLLTPSGRRILRERPVKLSEKGKEWQLQSTSRGRGNRGRGNRGRHR